MEENSSRALALLSYFLFPLFSLIVAIKNFRKSWAKNVVWAFIAFYAYHFSPAGDGVDVISYINRFHFYESNDFSIKGFIFSLYSEGSSTMDIIEPLLSYGLSKITSNFKVLLLFYGIIYGYFYSRNIWFFLDQFKGKVKLQSFLLLLWLLVTIGVWEINGFRFWCGSHMFLWGAINLIFVNKKKGLVFLFLSVFMHIGMAIPVLIVLAFRYIKTPSINILITVFFISYFLAELDLEFVRNWISANAPDFIKSKLLGYTSEDYVSQTNDKFQNYSIAFHIAKYIYIALKLVFISILYFNRNTFKNEEVYLLFKLFLFFGIFSNILSQIPSGGRYASITNFLLIGTYMVFIQNSFHYKFKRFLIIQYPLILLMAIYYFRIMGFYTFNIHHFINNPLTSFFIHGD